jgi:hypothetical protein
MIYGMIEIHGLGNYYPSLRFRLIRIVKVFSCIVHSKHQALKHNKSYRWLHCLLGKFLHFYCYDICLSRFVITALKAKEFHQRDVHYIVKDGHVEIVDEVNVIGDKERNLYAGGVKYS